MQPNVRESVRRNEGNSGTDSVPDRTTEDVPRWIGWFLIGIGAGIAGLWAVSLPGAFDQGLASYVGTPDTGSIPLFHVVAEGLMAATSLVAGLAVLRDLRSGRPLALVAGGMLVYSSINASGWLLHNQPATLAVTAGTLIGATLAVGDLLRSSPSS